MKTTNITAFRGADLNPFYVTLQWSTGTKYDLSDITSFDCLAEDDAGDLMFNIDCNIVPDVPETVVLTVPSSDIQSVSRSVTQGVWDLVANYSSGDSFRIVGGRIFMKDSPSTT